VVVPQSHLDLAREFHDLLDLSAANMTVPVVAVEGFGQPTPLGIVSEVKSLNDSSDYVFDLRGDGVVPNRPRKSRPSESPDCYLVRTTHGGLVAAPTVLAAIDDLLETGKTNRLELTSPDPDGVSVDENPPGARRGEAPFDRLVRRLEAREVLLNRSGPQSLLAVPLQDLASRVSPDERALEEMLTGAFYTREPKDSGSSSRTTAESGSAELPRIAVSLACLGIDVIHFLGVSGEKVSQPEGFSARRLLETLQSRPIDAIAVGHYLGVPPQGPEKSLDRSISLGLRDRLVERTREDGVNAKEHTPDLEPILAQYTERGLLRGELAQPFFLPDPRPSYKLTEDDHGSDRLIVVVGMGVAGRFGGPELTVLARELCWSLGRIGKRHLATVLIGSGKGNLPIPDAVHAWMRGVQQALGGTTGHYSHVEQITFTEHDPGRIAEFDSALSGEVNRLSGELSIEYTPKTPGELERFRATDQEQKRAKSESRWHNHNTVSGGERIPTRVNVQFDGEVLHFGAISRTASIPERRVPLKRWLVEAANSELAAEDDPALQLDRGQFLGHLLIPNDLRPQFFTRDPLVLMLDAKAARIHWEMVAQSDSDFVPAERSSGPGPDATHGCFREEYFLGTARGLTRQLRTIFAPPPVSRGQKLSHYRGQIGPPASLPLGALVGCFGEVMTEEW
jgi:hypothetical protein